MRPPLVDRSGPWFRSLDGTWRFTLADRPDAAPDGFRAPDFDDGAWSDVAVPGCWTMQGFDRPIYTNVIMPFDEFPPNVPEQNPTGCYRTHVRRPARVDRPARRVAHGRRRQRAATVGQRHRGRHQQGLAPRSRVRHHRARAVRRAEPARRAGRAVVRRVVRRGPGPVVARGPPPRGLPLQHAAHVPERRARDRVADARSRDRHPRPARQRAVRRSGARRRLGRRGAVRNRPRTRRHHTRVPRPGAALTRRVSVRRPHRAPAHAGRRRHAVVGRGTQPLPVAGRAARSRRQPARHRDDLDRVPAGRDQGPRLPRQRRTDPAARRESSRLRS